MTKELRTLSHAEVRTIRNAALDQFEEDAKNDATYARETVEFLAESIEIGQSHPLSGFVPTMEWWLDLISADPEQQIEVLGFNPYSFFRPKEAE